MSDPDTRTTPAPEAAVTMAFGIIHKRALGIAVGAAAALLVLVLTFFHVLASPVGGPNLGLLAQYFYGYPLTPAGAFVGAFWAFVAGFSGGWFLAFTRNFILALLLVFARARSDLDASGDILDHI